MAANVGATFQSEGYLDMAHVTVWFICVYAYIRLLIYV